MIFIVSFPKSGRTWFRKIVETYESRTNIQALKHKFTHIGYGYSSDRKEIRQLEYHDRNKVIFLSRDPADTFVSYYHDYIKRGPLEFIGTIDEFCLGKIDDFNKYVDDLSKYEQDYCLTYEEMIDDTKKAVLPVFEMLFEKVDEESLDYAIDFCGFKNLYLLERSGKIDMRTGGVEGYRKTRKGKIGSSIEELKSDTIHEIRTRVKRYVPAR